MCLCAVQQVSAQKAEPVATAIPEIKPLQIGDTIPDYLWHLPLQVVNHPEGRDTITLNDYKGVRLLILEFWGFSCTGCIKSISKLDTVKNAFGDQMALLPMHVLPYAFDETKMLDYVGKAIERNQWSVPSVVKDTALYRLFIQYLPDWGDVWILDGRLLAVPQHGYISEETITAVLNDGFADFRNRHNVSAIDPYRPLLENGDGKQLYTYEYGTVTSHIPHQYGMRFKFEHRGDSTFLYGWNRPLPELLYEAYKPDIMAHLTVESGILWETDSIDNNLHWEEDTTLAPIERVRAREAWNADNLYGYQLRLPGKITEAEARRMMQRDLEAFAKDHLALRLSVEPGDKHTYALLANLESREATEQLLTTSIGTPYNVHDDRMHRYVGYKKALFVENVSRALRLNPDVCLTIPKAVDGTGIPHDFKSRFEFPTSFREGTASLDTIRETLRMHGLAFTIEQEKVPMLVVRSTAHALDTLVPQSPIH